MKVYAVLNELDYEPDVIRDMCGEILYYISQLKLLSSEEKARKEAERCLINDELSDKEWDTYQERRWEDVEYGFRYTNDFHSYLIIELEVK